MTFIIINYSCMWNFTVAHNVDLLTTIYTAMQWPHVATVAMEPPQANCDTHEYDYKSHNPNICYTVP